MDLLLKATHRKNNNVNSLVTSSEHIDKKFESKSSISIKLQLADQLSIDLNVGEVSGLVCNLIDQEDCAEIETDIKREFKNMLIPYFLAR